jgi:hypothetical protein
MILTIFHRDRHYQLIKSVQPWLQEVALTCTQSADFLLHAMSESLAPKHTALCVKHGQNPKVSRLRKSSLPILAPISMSISWGMPHFHGNAQFTNLARHRSSQILTSWHPSGNAQVLKFWRTWSNPKQDRDHWLISIPSELRNYWMDFCFQYSSWNFMKHCSKKTF